MRTLLNIFSFKILRWQKFRGDQGGGQLSPQPYPLSSVKGPQIGQLRMMQCPNVPTNPIMAIGCRQCLPLSVVQLKGKPCRKPHCRNGVVDTFGHCVAPEH